MKRLDRMKKKQPTLSDQTMELYLKEISKSKGLSSTEEVRLSKLIQQGDKEAFNKLVSSNLRFVISVVKRYQNQGLPLSDLISIGNVGLIRAAKKFDGWKNYKFISYAVWWIRQAVLQALAEQSRIVKVPINKVQQISAIREKKNIFEQKNKKKCSENDLLEDTSLTNIELLCAVDSKPVFLDAPTGLEENITLLDLMIDSKFDLPDKCIENISIKKISDIMMGKLNEREKIIIERFFGFNGYHVHTLEDISEHLNISRERVRQLKEKALEKLKKVGRSRNLEKEA